ncbi:MAG: hypothetical protein M1823_005189 [Watsoniomyces obsoletus]|nr:MAG: hypothetical protein M1823_005189 [Watsoniomyces obsoletus]
MVYHAVDAAMMGLPSRVGMLATGVVGRGYIADATSGISDTGPSLASDTILMPSVGTAAAAATAAAEGTTQSGSLTTALVHVRNLGGIFNYLTSRWAVSCFALWVILNRTQIYAAARRRTRLTWPSRLALRIIPILLFLHATQRLLQAMRCQTSPAYMEYLNPNATADAPQTVHEAGSLHSFSAATLFWQDDLQSCRGVGMVPALSKPDQSPLRGSLSLLWPLFQIFSLSSFVETLSCTIQGREIKAETALTILEHSLIFAEAEAAVSHHLGWGLFGRPGTGVSGAQEVRVPPALSAVNGFRRSTMLAQHNTTPQVLLIGLVSSLSHLTSHILGVFNLQKKYRLLSTGIWGLTFMGMLAGLDISGFPTICIVGFVPHILILVGIGICGIIYSMALLLIAFSPLVQSQHPSSFKERISLARENLQANMHFSSVRVDRSEDFFNALLNVGFTALLAASEAVFLNEGRPVGLRMWTWLEEDRLREVERAQAFDVTGRSSRRWDHGVAVADGVALTDSTASPSQSQSGYAREKSMKKLDLGEGGSMNRARGDDVGLYERSARFRVVCELFRGISCLVMGWFITAVVKALEMFGVDARGWRVAQYLYGKQRNEQRSKGPTPSKPTTLDFWLLTDDGELQLPPDENVDVEVEMRKRMTNRNGRLSSPEERELDKNLYGWWKQGGWFGELDSSGDYVPDMEDGDDDRASDTSSVCSMSSTAARGEGSGWDTEDERQDENDDGMTTPTRDQPTLRRRQSSPRPDLTRDLDRLAQLLNPKTQSQRQEAQMLAHHLQHPTPLTRSQYRRSLQREQTRVLTSGIRRRRGLGQGLTSASSSAGNNNQLLSPDEEAEILEHLILSRREFFREQQQQFPEQES